jgi:hypothetical protein
MGALPRGLCQTTSTCYQTCQTCNHPTTDTPASVTGDAAQAKPLLSIKKCSKQASYAPAQSQSMLILPRDLTIQGGPQRYSPSPHLTQPVQHLSGAVATSTDTEQVVLVHVPLLWQLHARRQGGACVGTQSTPCGQEGRGSKHSHIFGNPCSPRPVAKPDTQTAATHYTISHTMTHTESPEARLPVRIAPTPRCT